MGAISTIRKHYGIVVGLIGVAIAAFILTDILSPEGGSLITPDDSVGKIAGEEIQYNQYQQRLRIARENYTAQTGQTRMSPTRQIQIENDVWEEMVNEIILRQETEDLKIAISDQELIDMVNPDDPHPLVREMLTDQTTGRFEGEQLRQFLNAAQQDPQARGQLLQLEDAIEHAHQQNKYLNLVQKSFYTTDLEAKDNFYNENRTAQVDFFGISTAAIPDDEIEVGQSALENYYQDNRGRFERDEERDFRFITYEVAPSEEDSLEYRTWLEDQIDLFAETDNDTSFVEINSDREILPAARNLGEIDPPAQDEVVNAEEGDVVGPYLFDGQYNITKVIEVRDDTQYTMNARQIFIDADDEDEPEQLANDLRDRITGGEDFETIAQNFGMDEYAFDGGNLGWFREGLHNEDLEEAIINTPVGDITVIQTDEGYHVLEVLREPIRKLFVTATVSREIIPSSDTFADLYDVAFDFSREANNPESFEQLAEEQGKQVQEAGGLTTSDQFIRGLGPAREIIQWIFENNEHDVSGVFETQETFVVGYISNAYQEGYLALDEVENQVRNEVRESRKQEEIIRLLKEQKDQGGDIRSISAEFDANVHSESRLAFRDNNITSFGRQPRFIGGIFGLQPNILSHPIKGDEAVFMAQIGSFADVQLPEDLRNDRDRLTQQRKEFAYDNAFSKLREMADIQDRRYQYY